MVNARINKPELVLLDLDGTLVDSLPHLTLSIDSMLADLELPAAGAERVSTWIGNGAEVLVERALSWAMDTQPDASASQRAMQGFSDYYLQFNHRSRLYPGVREALDYLKSIDCKMGCVTNKRGRFTEPLLRSLGLYDEFHIIISGDTLARKKPDPLPLLHATKVLGASRDRTLMVGDSRSDVQAARAAGIPVLCVDYGYNHGSDIREENPDFVVASLQELRTLFHESHG